MDHTCVKKSYLGFNLWRYDKENTEKPMSLKEEFIISISRKKGTCYAIPRLTGNTRLIKRHMTGVDESVV